MEINVNKRLIRCYLFFRCGGGGGFFSLYILVGYIDFFIYDFIFSVEVVFRYFMLVVRCGGVGVRYFVLACYIGFFIYIFII